MITTAATLHVWTLQYKKTPQWKPLLGKTLKLQDRGTTTFSRAAYLHTRASLHPNPARLSLAQRLHLRDEQGRTGLKYVLGRARPDLNYLGIS